MLTQLNNAKGLSPRVRGNPRRRPRPARPPGSIPACAGEPPPSSPSPCSPGVYPRVCGGTPPRPAQAAWTAGLSPRVRGNPGRIPLGGIIRRSIPACAGEPIIRIRTAAFLQVYPRVCGGTRSRRQACRDGRGLSPRVRGNLALAIRASMPAGSIPACAGEPRIRVRTSPHLRVYPRVCGGTSLIKEARSEASGLSPRVRGNPEPRLPRPLRRRSIPACAGEPTAPAGRRSAGRVYPRVCGGTVATSHHIHAQGGLSPRVRGNPASPAATTPAPRSIPACAGEPLAHAGPRRRRQVYPRVCGGTGSGGSVAHAGRGLSPRVRGNQNGGGGVGQLAGSIPACAGEPQLAVPAVP